MKNNLLPIEFSQALESCYKLQYDKDNTPKKLELELNGIIELLKSIGFFRFGDNKLYVLIQNRVVYQMAEQLIFDKLEDIVKEYFIPILELPNKILIEKIYRNKNNIQNLFDRLRRDVGFDFLADTKTTGHFFYQNGYTVCNSEKWAFFTYENTDKLIWDSNRQKRDFVFLPDFLMLQEDISHIENVVFARATFGDFANFCYNISGNTARFRSLCSIIGYMLHDFRHTQLRALVLTDSSISKKAEGRTGKTLLGKALQFARNLCEINGKDFKPQDEKRYSKVNINTQIVFINDLTKHFSLDALYNDITEGISVRKLYADAFALNPKMLLSTNQTLRLDCASSRARVLEFELTNYYSENFSPEKDFGHWFFSGWDALEWQKYDNFMCFCLCTFLENGIIETPQINLNQRRLLDSTTEEFCEFMAEQMQNWQKYQTTRIDKKLLFELFCKASLEEYKPSAKKFYNWLKYFTELDSHFKQNFTLTDFNLKSNGEQYLVIQAIAKTPP